MSPKKSDHLADIRGTSIFKFDRSLPTFKIKNCSDTKKRSYSTKYLTQLKVDPDNILSQSEKEVFHQLHRQFAHLFTPQPGRYNGNWGYVENRLKFSTPPPPNSKTYIPNYSPSMNQTLAEKMDGE